MKTYDQRIARAWVDVDGYWWLRVAGTDIDRIVWHEREMVNDNFPGNALGYRLIEFGWMPDKRAMYGPLAMSTPEKLALTELAGWRPAGEKTWTIPCYKEHD